MFLTSIMKSFTHVNLIKFEDYFGEVNLDICELSEAVVKRCSVKKVFFKLRQIHR